MSNGLVKKGNQYFGTDPAVIVELKALSAKNDGLVKAQDVVEAARDEDSPLHSKFEWNDGEAAEKFRLIQARTLLSISVQYIARGHTVEPRKVFVSLSTDRSKRHGAGYRTLTDVLSDPDMKNQLLMDSLEQMTHFQEKYKSLKELSDVLVAMDKTIKQIKK